MAIGNTLFYMMDIAKTPSLYQNREIARQH